ncbi:ABC transporter ATP-binding protein [Vibrio olivae]|uniref:ABC transporter ATP-binding protein n=1 Tax=Vibrio olivae TaxID=1243002 RepID=A0ABV5HMV6_9VIBR
MPKLNFRNLSKSFGDHTVIREFNAEVSDREFLVLLGPSGCGKSTLLRMIAGLSDISGGDFLIDDQVANDWSPKERGIAFVFQTYALYPHLTVRENIAFPLMMNRFNWWHHLPMINTLKRWSLMNDASIVQATDKIAEQLELTPLLDRRPAALSGGQRQRVALARSLVRDPSIYLLDEPLSNLDAKLRTQMRSEISALHKKVKKTFVYVTHDQVEAMTMATRIIIMNQGEIQQVDTPENIYNDPRNTFVARFIGSPAMNLVTVDIDGNELNASGRESWEHPGALPDASKAIIGVRPEKMILAEGLEGLIKGHIVAVEKLGAETVVGLNVGLDVDEDDEESLIEKDTIFIRVPGNVNVEIGQQGSFSYDAQDCYWFDEQTGERIENPAGKLYELDDSVSERVRQA